MPRLALLREESVGFEQFLSQEAAHTPFVNYGSNGGIVSSPISKTMLLHDDSNPANLFPPLVSTFAATTLGWPPPADVCSPQNARRIVPMMRAFRKRRRSTRLGTTVVETALVLPLFLLFVFGLVELGRAIFVQHVLNSACRRAARIGSTEGNSTAVVKAKALQVLETAINTTAVQVYVKDASPFDTASPGTSGAALESLSDIELMNADPRQMFMVRAKVKYDDIAIVKHIPVIGYFLKNVTLDGQAFMRHE